MFNKTVVEGMYGKNVMVMMKMKMAPLQFVSF